MSSIFGLLVLVLVLGAAVGGFRLIGGGRRDEPSDAAGVRSLFAYVLTFVALIVGAIGIAGVLGALVDPPATARRSRFSAGELASAVVGVPVFLALAKSTIKRLVADEREAAGGGWSLYINVTLLTGLVTTLVFVFIVADDLLRGDVDPSDIATLVVWGAVWGAHWWAWDRFGDARRPDVYWFVSSIVGLAMFVGGFVVVLATLIERIIDAVEPAIVAAGRSGDVDMAVVTLVVGGVVWAWHWLRTGLPGESSSAWLLYVVLVGILGSVTMIYVGTVGALIRVTVWFVGRPDTSSGAEYFRDSSALLPIAIAGAGVWWYHRAVLGPRRTAERGEPAPEWGEVRARILGRLASE